MMRFRIGQEVVCINKEPWEYSSYGPRYNEIVTIDEYRGLGYVTIAEYSQKYAYQEYCFAPILENLDEIKEALNETIEI